MNIVICHIGHLHKPQFTFTFTVQGDHVILSVILLGGTELFLDEHTIRPERQLRVKVTSFVWYFIWNILATESRRGLVRVILQSFEVEECEFCFVCVASVEIFPVVTDDGPIKGGIRNFIIQSPEAGLDPHPRLGGVFANAHEVQSIISIGCAFTCVVVRIDAV